MRWCSSEGCSGVVLRGCGGVVQRGCSGVVLRGCGGVVVRMLDSYSRGPRLKSSCWHFKVCSLRVASVHAAV